MPDSVGSVSVDVVPDARGFSEKLKAQLKDQKVDVRAVLDDRALKAELDKATRTREVTVKVRDNGSIGKTNRDLHLLSTAIIGLAPAAAPLTAAGIAAGAAFAGLGVTGALAIKGIKDAMKAGTPLGVKYAGMVGGLKADLAGLEKVAAGGVLKGFSASANVLNGQMPGLRREVGLLAKSLGSDLTPITHGLIGLFKDLGPVVNDLADGGHRVAVEFDAWATGPGGRAFAAYIAQALPQVEATLQALASAGGHLVTALLPLGGPVLQGIQGISSAISSLPVQTIQDMFLAFAAYRTITLAAAAADTFNAALKRLGATAALTSTKVGGLGAAEGVAGRGVGAVAGGPIGLAVGGAALLGVGLYQAHQENVAADRQRAAQKQDPAFVARVRAQIAQQQQQLAAAQASAGNGFSTLQSSGSSLFGGGQSQQKILQMQGSIKTLQASIKGATTATAADTATNKANAASLDKSAAAALRLTNALNKSNQVLTVRGAKRDFQASIDAATKALKANGTSLDINTAKGRANQSALDAIASSTDGVIAAQKAHGASQKTLDGTLAAGRDALVKQAEKLGLNASKAKALADRLLGIPKHVTSEVKLQGLSAANAALTRYSNHINAVNKQAANGSLGVPRATGGPIYGPGTGTSDSIPAWLSNGEYVLRASAVQKIGVPALDRMNRFADGGLAGKLSKVKGYAGGGTVLGDPDSHIFDFLNASFSSASDVRSAQQSVDSRKATLKSAEAALHRAKSADHKDNEQIHADELRVKKDREALAAATEKLTKVQKSYAASKQPLLKQSQTAAASDVKDTGKFITNLETLRARGYGFLANQYLEQFESGDQANAEKLAAQAAKAPKATDSRLQATYKASARQQTSLTNLGAGGSNALYGPKGGTDVPSIVFTAQSQQFIGSIDELTTAWSRKQQDVAVLYQLASL